MINLDFTQRGQGYMTNLYPEVWFLPFTLYAAGQLEWSWDKDEVVRLPYYDAESNAPESDSAVTRYLQQAYSVNEIPLEIVKDSTATTKDRVLLVDQATLIKAVQAQLYAYYRQEQRLIVSQIKLANLTDESDAQYLEYFNEQDTLLEKARQARIKQKQWRSGDVLVIDEYEGKIIR